MSRTHACHAAVLIAAAGSLAMPTWAQPVRQIPIVRTPTPQPTQPATQPGQPSTQPGSPGTVQVTLGGQTINVSPNDAASIAAWKEKLRQFAVARGIEPVRRADGQPVYTNTRDYIVPTNGGKGEGLVSLPEHFEVGVWFAGSGADGLSLASVGARPAQPAPSLDPSSVIGKLVGPSTPGVQTEITRLTPTAMTPEAVAAARAKFPKEQGWSEIWLGGGGKMIARTNPSDLANGLSALTDAWGLSGDRLQTTSVNDLVKSYKIWNERCEGVRNRTIRDSSVRARPEVEESPKYTIDPSVVPAQIQLIHDSQKLIQDDGRLERALAITEMQQLVTWKRGVQRLADVYLAHPELSGIAPSCDFSDLTGDVVRKLINQIVADANRGGDAKGLVAAAALMVTERRIEPALNTLSRARKLSTEQSDKDAIDGLFSAINALPRQ